MGEAIEKDKIDKEYVARSLILYAADVSDVKAAHYKASRDYFIATAKELIIEMLQEGNNLQEEEKLTIEAILNRESRDIDELIAAGKKGETDKISRGVDRLVEKIMAETAYKQINKVKSETDFFEAVKAYSQSVEFGNRLANFLVAMKIKQEGGIDQNYFFQTKRVLRERPGLISAISEACKKNNYQKFQEAVRTLDMNVQEAIRGLYKGRDLNRADTDTIKRATGRAIATALETIGREALNIKYHGVRSDGKMSIKSIGKSRHRPEAPL